MPKNIALIKTLSRKKNKFSGKLRVGGLVMIVVRQRDFINVGLVLM